MEDPDDDLSLPNAEDIDSQSIKLQSQISLIKVKIKQLEESRGQLASEKSDLKKEKANLEKEKANLEKEKANLEKEKANLDNRRKILEEENIKANVCLQRVDNNVMPSREELPTELAITATTTLEKIRKKLRKYRRRNSNEIAETYKLISEKDKLIGEKDKLIREVNKHISEVNKHIGEKDKHISEKDKHIGEVNKEIAGKEKQLGRARKKLQLLNNEGTVVGPDPPEPKSGLLYVQKSHRISVYEKSNLNIGILEKISGSSSIARQDFKPKQNLQELAISTKMRKAWVLVRDTGLTNDQFIDKLVKLLVGLDESIVRSAWQSLLIEFPSKDIGLMGEMALQQFVYPPFAYLFKAAVGIENENLYKADQNVKSSLSVQYKAKEETTDTLEKVVMIKPDGAAIFHEEGWDAFGMMEIKRHKPSYDESHRLDYDKCVLATSITALAIKRAIPKKSDKYKLVVIPFLIATGKVCSLYATTLDKNGDPCVKKVIYPGSPGGNLTNKRFASASCIERKEIFTALAVLLSNFNEFVSEYIPASNTRVQERTGALKGLDVLTLSKTNKSNHDGSNKTRKDSTQEKGKSKEGDAQEAAACGGKFMNVTSAFMKILGFNDISISEEEQTHSPFFFVGYKTPLTDETMTASKVFLKVWNAEDVKMRSVEAEWRHYKQAYNAGVPVASPALPKVARSTSSCGSEYLIIAVEYMHQDSIKNVNDLVQFCHSLVETVEKLHTHAKILHCDLKPDNIRWSKGIVHLIDFGHAQPIGSARSLRSTKGFEAPEILNAVPCSTQTDTYSVGKTILHTLQRLRNVTIQQSQCYGILHEVAVNLSNPNPKARWHLMQALGKIKECVTTQDNYSITMMKAGNKVPNPVTASPSKWKTKKKVNLKGNEV